MKSFQMIQTDDGELKATLSTYDASGSLINTEQIEISTLPGRLVDEFLGPVGGQIDEPEDTADVYDRMRDEDETPTTKPKASRRKGGK